MSAGPLVASATGIALLIVTAYVLIGGTLSTTEVMAEAQSNLVAYQEARMRTAIEIQETVIDNQTLYVKVKNTGSESIVDFPSIDVYLQVEGEPVYVPYGTDLNHWSKVSIEPDGVHPGQIDPGETLTISITYAVGVTPPTWVQVVTPNGVTGSAYINSGE
ncbi:flagellar protein FlaF [Methanoculleus thermophilus]|mgnify:FL=1|jgi:flagellar protein FlaF|uniref:Flagellar protein FlaF n=1 Tax=Methanoculleus thermophilus TaxID=2200 RepID=A0A1G9AH99_9EURY|nr:flagellar protein FlaF [Methanoculleus thermophilus]SDK26623.1 flagellar protein FlaF [Methanoculleus thermophilus]